VTQTVAAVAVEMVRHDFFNILQKLSLSGLSWQCIKLSIQLLKAVKKDMTVDNSNRCLKILDTAHIILYLN
jgi:hypothetical protein